MWSTALGSLGRDVSRGNATVDDQRLPGHPARLVAGEEERAVGDFDRLAKATHRNMHQTAVALRVGQAGRTPLYVAINGQLAAMLAVADPLKLTCQMA